MSTSKLLDLETLVRARNEELASRAAAKFASAVQPIYGANNRDDPVHIGSAVLLDVHGTKVMITAAHVIDNNSCNRPTRLYVGGGANLELIEAEFAISAAPDHLRQLDRYDIAFGALPSAMTEKLGGTYIGVADMARHAPYEQGRLYTAIGFPNTMNKVSLPERKDKRLHPELLSYSNSYRLDEEVARGLPNGGADHIVIPYGDKWKDVDGSVQNAKKPIGMSGGAVIDCGRASIPDVAAGTKEPTQRLAGISIEFKEKRVLIAIRMAVVLSELEKLFPPPLKEKREVTT